MKELRHLTDTNLVELLKNGKQIALTEIIRRNELIIAKTVKGMLGDTPEAEDVGLDVFVRFYKSVKNFKGDSKISTYLTRIAINLSLNELKKRKRKGEYINTEVDETMLADITDTVDSSQQKEIQDAIEKAFSKLDSVYRSVAVLRLIDGYSTKEVAEILDLPIGTVLSRLSRAQQKLRKNLGHLKN